MLKIGIIGMSEDDGHPYSWSAIVNGDFDDAVMAECGFPTIPSYLSANRDTIGTDGAKVTHIWCKEGKEIATHCAKASYIDNVCDNITDMIGQVDAVLLARDDPETHVALSKPFIEAGIPIFIDKPLAYNTKDLEWFTKQVNAGKFVMSSSPLRYSAGVQHGREDVARAGQIELAVAVGKKNLRSYAIHYLESMFSVLSYPTADTVQHVSKTPGKDVIFIEFKNGILGLINIFKDIAPGDELNIYGQKKIIKVNHAGTYTCFRTQLVEAIRSFNDGKPRTNFADTHKVIATLIAARESLENDGKKILVKNL